MAATRDLGLAALQHGDFNSAISHLERACAKTPGDWQTLLCLAGAYHQVKRDEDAVRTLREVVRLQPGSARAYYNLGISLDRLHRYEEARGALRHALTLQPDYGLAARVLAQWEQAAPPDSTETVASAGSLPITASRILERTGASTSLNGEAAKPYTASNDTAATPAPQTRKLRKGRRLAPPEQEALAAAAPTPVEAAPAAPLEEAEPHEAQPTRRRFSLWRRPQPADREALSESEVIPAGGVCPEARQAMWLALYSLIIVGFGCFFGPMAISRALNARSQIGEIPEMKGRGIATAAIVIAAMGVVLSLIEWGWLFVWAARS